MKNTILTLILILIAALICGGCSRMSYIDRQMGRESLAYPHIRVNILNTDKLEIDCQGTYQLNCILADSTAKGYYSVAPLRAIYAKNGITLADENSVFVLDTAIFKIFVSPRKPQSHIMINGSPFRGILEINADSGMLMVINVLNLESYLKGVLPPEIGRLKDDAFEALKAQSVAARTYAYSRIKNNSDKAYDLVNSIMDQVYIGIRGEYDLANKAIEETRGEVLTYQGKPVTAYYHSTCGGKTEDVENVWNEHINGYLKSVDDSDYCKWSKFYTWEMKWEPQVLEDYLLEYLIDKRGVEYDELEINDIMVKERFPSGRISHLAVETNHGEILLFKDQIRWAFRRPSRPTAILPSSNFEILVWRDHHGKIVEFSAEGRGYGHGVGMCQTGAIGRARAGQGYRQILGRYYSGVEITGAY